MIIFSDLESKYQLLDYHPTHGQLLIRSFSNKNRDYNIDITFKVVTAYLAPIDFYGLEISVSSSDIEEKYLQDRFNLVNKSDDWIFRLKDAAGKTYFINAGCFGIYHNKLDILVTSLERYDWGDYQEERKLWYIPQRDSV